MKALQSSITVSFIMMLIFSLIGCEPRDEERLVYKPNIYIYPEEEIKLEVFLEFPQGGHVVTSIPEYIGSWDITVDQTGLIDESYSYLFYESSQPDMWQRTKGWVIEREHLESFFRENLTAYGFAGKEIDDFNEYWIPKLNQHKYYLICPQTKDEIDPLVSRLKSRDTI